MIEPDHFSLRSERDAGVRRITPVGELDLATVPILQREYRRALEDPAARMIVVDLRRLTFIDSTGIGVLLHMSAECAEADRLRLINGSPAVERLIELIGVRRRLPVISSDDDPLAPVPPAGE